MTIPTSAVVAVSEEIAAVDERNADNPAAGAMPKAGARYVAALLIATGGVFIAFIAPLAISLAVRLEQIAPGQAELLGYVTGVGSLAAMLTAPVVGILSDRTRSRLGRRRPWMLGAMVLGVISLLILAGASSFWMLMLGWVVAQMGWASIAALLSVTQADRIPPEQRGKIAGFNGFITMVAPVIGVGIASAFVGSNLLLFLVPGAFGVIGVIVYVLLVGGDDSRALNLTKATVKSVFKNYLYKPSDHPSFSWNWLGRSIFTLGTTFATTFGLFFFANRMGASVEAVAPLAALLSLVGVLTAAIGAIVGGVLSDRLRKRRLFVFLAALIFSAGALVMAFGTDLPVLIAGSAMTQLGLGMFSAVDQAIMLDVLPDRERDAGRFVGINNFSITLPAGAAPLLAAPILLIGATGDAKNYTLLLVIAAASTIIGGLIVLLKVKGSN